MPCWYIYFYKVRYKNWVPLKGFHSRGHEFWKWQSKPHKRKLSTKTNTAPNAPDLREHCRHSSSCWVRPSMDDPSAKHHLTTANANTARNHTGCPVLRCGARSENIWLHLLPPEECTVLLQAGSHHTKAHPTHKCQLMCSNHSPECRLYLVKIAFPFFGQL